MPPRSHKNNISTSLPVDGRTKVLLAKWTTTVDSSSKHFHRKILSLPESQRSGKTFRHVPAIPVTGTGGGGCPSSDETYTIFITFVEHFHVYEQSALALRLPLDKNLSVGLHHIDQALPGKFAEHFPRCQAVEGLLSLNHVPRAPRYRPASPCRPINCPFDGLRPLALQQGRGQHEATTHVVGRSL